MKWTEKEMKKIAKQEEKGRYVYVNDTGTDLLEMDSLVFKKRPDLILHLSYDKIPDKYQDAIINMQYLKNIAISITKPQNLDFLSLLNQLNYLELYAKKTIEIDFISNLKQLNYLDLRGSFSSFESIGNCKSLKTLLMHRSTIDDLDFLEGSNVDYLLLDVCKIADISSLDKNRSLKTLVLSENHNIENIDFIKSMESLEVLNIDQSKVNRLFDFSHLKSLKELHLRNMKSLTDISSLKSVPSLEKLYLNEIGSKVKKDDFTVLTEMSSLKELYIDFLDYTKRTDHVKKMIIDKGKENILKEGLIVTFPKNMPRVLYQ